MKILRLHWRRLQHAESLLTVSTTVSGSSVVSSSSPLSVFERVSLQVNCRGQVGVRSSTS